MAGIAFLPWEEWIGRLIHSIAVAIRRRLYQQRHNRSLATSTTWPQAEGTVFQVNSDFSNPREEIVYYYSTESGYHSGFFWRWFDSSDGRQVRAGDVITLRYDPEEPDRSVAVGFHSEVSAIEASPSQPD